MDPVNLEDFKSIAKGKLARATYEFYEGAADDEYTHNETRDVYEAIKLKAKALANADAFEGLGSKFLGHDVSAPIGIAPTAFHRLAHDEGECATAKAAQTHNVVICTSSVANYSVEEISAAAPNALKIFQIYLSKMPEYDKDIFQRVKDCGYKAVVVTADTQTYGNRENEERNNWCLPKFGVGN